MKFLKNMGMCQNFNFQNAEKTDKFFFSFVAFAHLESVINYDPRDIEGVFCFSDPCCWGSSAQLVLDALYVCLVNKVSNKFFILKILFSTL